MTTATVERLYEQLLDLDESEREELLGRFGLLPDDWQPPPAWIAEINGRHEQYLAGDRGRSLEDLRRALHEGL